MIFLKGWLFSSPRKRVMVTNRLRPGVDLEFFNKNVHYVVINRFTKLFIDKFCDDMGTIDWVKLVEFNSGNYDLDKFLP